MPASIVVGAQWGDEGKAKIIDLLAENADVIMRYQGGCNAGHTVVRPGQTYKFHLVPSGILYPGKLCLLGPGTVVLPEQLEIETSFLAKQGIPLDNFFISERAHLTFPFHTQLDEVRETLMADNKIGTTLRGIGPTYEDKMARLGIRVGDLKLSPVDLENRLTHILAYKNPMLKKVYGLKPFELDELLALCRQYREQLSPFMANTDEKLATALQRNDRILLEGAQGTMLDVDHGTYPYVTSSNPTAGGACVGSGLGPRHISGVLGVAKAYATRVGEGPFPTELFDETANHLLTVGREFGTTTGRARRCGWFDAVAMRYAVQINGMTALAITKLDVLDEIETIQICKHYRHRLTGEIVTMFPGQMEFLRHLEPVYDRLPGWTGTVKHARTWEELPAEAQQFLNHISTLSGVPIAIVSIGPERDETIPVEPNLSRAGIVFEPSATPAFA